MRQNYLILLVCISYPLLALIPLNDQQRNAVIQKFAPEVRFHVNEKYFPMDVNEFLKFVDLRDNNAKVILPKGQVTGQKLAAYSGPQYAGYFLGFADKSMKGGVKPDQNKIVHSPMYANFTPLKDGAVIQYLFFMPFNGPFQIGELPLSFDKVINKVTKTGDIGDHEGDWEHISVFLKGTIPENLALQDVYFARHSPSKDGSFEKPELVEGTHPVVYSSKWGHASHAKHRDRQADQDATSANGPRWRGWENVQYVGTKENPTPGHEWLKFAGHFGGTDRGKDSPETPPMQAWWRSSAEQVRSEVLARVTVTQNPNNKKQSPEFEIKSTPTYIRKLNWSIVKVNTPPGISPNDIAFSVYNSKGNLLFSNLKGPQATTPLKDKKMYIGSVIAPGRINVSFDVEVRGQFDN